MHEETSDATHIAANGRTQRVFEIAELLRAELAEFVHPKALHEMIDLAVVAAEKAPMDDVARELRAYVAGMLLNRVGQFMVATQPAVDGSDRITRPPARKRAVA